MLNGSSSKSSSSRKSSSKSSSSRQVSGVHLSGGYGGSSSSGSRSSSSSGSYRPSGGSSNAWTSGSLNGSGNKASGAGGKSPISIGSGGSKTSSSGGKISGYGGYSTPVPSGAKKVSLNGSGSSIGSGTRKGPTATSNVLGAYTASKQPAASGGGIPRYSLPGFQAISTPNSTGKIKGWNGGKLVNGVIKYPTNAKVDPAKAARAQAFVDYSYGNSTNGNSSMGRIYGQDYYDELERLANLPIGAPAWGDSSSGNKQQGSGGNHGGNSGAGGGFSGGYSYEEALRQAQEAAAEALRQQVEQGVSDIYAQKEPLESQLRKSAQQLYIANMQGKKALPQQMAAQGLTGGASESANLALETTFGDGLSGLLEYYNQAIAQLDRDAANLRASGNLQQAQNVAEFAKQLAQYAYETQQRLLEVQSQKELAAYRSDLDYDKWMRQQQY